MTMMSHTVSGRVGGWLVGLGYGFGFGFGFGFGVWVRGAVRWVWVWVLALGLGLGLGSGAVRWAGVGRGGVDRVPEWQIKRVQEPM